MKKIIFTFNIVILFFSATIKAQSIDVDWSEKMLYNKKNGYFKEFIGSNSKNVYAKFGSLNSIFGNEKQKKIKLVAFDLNSMEKTSSAYLINQEDPKAAESYKGLVYNKTIEFENVVYVFWIKESKAKDELFVQTFDSNLEPIEKLKKIYELNSDKDDTKKAELFVLGNKKVGESILIGGELASKKGENITIEYKVLKSDLSFSSSNKVKLPISNSEKSNNLLSTYEYGDDGNMHIKSIVKMDKEERKNAKKGESKSYPIYSIVNLSSGKIQSYTMKFDTKNILSFGFKVAQNVIKIFGFFNDLNKDPKGKNTHGIFYAALDPSTLLLNSEINFTYFTKQQLTELFSKELDKADKNKSLFNKNKSNDESIVSDYKIENVQSIDNNNIVLFCSRMNNYTVTSTDSKGNTTTRYYCEKANVTAFKLDLNGKLIWSSNLDRRKTYSGWNILDLKVVNRGDKFIVAYGSDFSMNSDKKSLKTLKSRKYQSDRFEYAIFDYNNGKFKKEEYKVNPINVKKADRKTISANEITILNNELYTNSEKINHYFFRKGRGYLGHISIGK